MKHRVQVRERFRRNLSPLIFATISLSDWPLRPPFPACPMKTEIRKRAFRSADSQPHPSHTRRQRAGAPFYSKPPSQSRCFVSSPNLLFEETAGRLLPVSIISTRPVVSSPIKRESPSIAGGRPFIAFQRHHPYHQRVAYTYALSSGNTRGSICHFVSPRQLSFARFFTFSLATHHRYIFGFLSKILEKYRNARRQIVASRARPVYESGANYNIKLAAPCRLSCSSAIPFPVRFPREQGCTARRGADVPNRSSRSAATSCLRPNARNESLRFHRWTKG